MGAKRGMPELASGDGASRSPLSSGHKQIGHEMLPSRHARAQLTGGDHFQRSIGNYAKQAPDSLTGVGNSGLNIVKLANS